MKIILGIIVALIVLAGIGYYFLYLRKEPTLVEIDQPQISQSPQDPGTQTTPNLPQGGNSYLDPEGVFTLLYPNDYTQDIQNNGQAVRFMKRGATQTGQTELFDGALIVFETESLNGQNLSSWVDSRIKTTTADGTLQVIQPKKSITINGQPGFEYSTRGLGESRNIILQKDANSGNAVIITMLVADPQNVGYQGEVDATLNTLKILK